RPPRRTARLRAAAHRPGAGRPAAGPVGRLLLKEARHVPSSVQTRSVCRGGSRPRTRRERNRAGCGPGRHRSRLATAVTVVLPLVVACPSLARGFFRARAARPLPRLARTPPPARLPRDLHACGNAIVARATGGHRHACSNTAFAHMASLVDGRQPDTGRRTGPRCGVAARPGRAGAMAEHARAGSIQPAAAAIRTANLNDTVGKWSLAAGTN